MRRFVLVTGSVVLVIGFLLVAVGFVGGFFKSSEWYEIPAMILTGSAAWYLAAHIILKVKGATAS